MHNFTRRLSIAPMLDWTDRHYRYFVRFITRHTLLYTEMVTTAALLHGDRNRLLRFDSVEHPLAIQFAGSDPSALAQCARIGAIWGYDEINLNVGCPSDRVQNGRFGACLMAEPQLVAECVAAMKNAVTLPVTVKTRIGIDDRDSYGELVDFVGAQVNAGCDALIVHARKAWLKGLSPKENRDVPPLRYDVVHQLKMDFPALSITLNGGITTLTAAANALTTLDGVMIGREAYHNPWLLADADRLIFGTISPPITREQVLEQFLPYAAKQLAQGVPLSAMSRHLLGLFQGQPGARAWRRQISEQAHQPNAGLSVLALPQQIIDSLE
ncbi:tRNA dihydrouridine(20/20a) synthase DusA [Chromatium weissei]|nr:tRNA dihydrouridine(20/20a) synthase DusA [Chromatium weissei]